MYGKVRAPETCSFRTQDERIYTKDNITIREISKKFVCVSVAKKVI